jgi:hypothetical protein
MIEGSGSESITLTNGSGSGFRWPKNIWIRPYGFGSGSATLLKQFNFMKTNLIKVCEVRARETETVAVQLAKNQYGHKVIINMIEVHSAIQIKGFLSRELFI